MRRTWPITILICLLLLGGGVVVLLIPQVIPFEQSSDVYKKYANMDGVDATYIKDFKVNDTVPVDVTLLEAKTDSAWNVLQEDFDVRVPEVPEEYREAFINANPIYFWLASKGNYKERKDTIISHNDIIVVSPQTQTICVGHLKNKKQAEAIINRKIDELSTNP